MGVSLKTVRVRILFLEDTREGLEQPLINSIYLLFIYIVELKKKTLKLHKNKNLRIKLKEIIIKIAVLSFVFVDHV